MKARSFFRDKSLDEEITIKEIIDKHHKVNLNEFDILYKQYDDYYLIMLYKDNKKLTSISNDNGKVYTTYEYQSGLSKDEINLISLFYEDIKTNIKIKKRLEVEQLSLGLFDKSEYDPNWRTNGNCIKAGTFNNGRTTEEIIRDQKEHETK